MRDASITTEQHIKAANVSNHKIRNGLAATAAAERRQDRIQGHLARNAVAQADAMEAAFERRELHRQWNAEEHYAAVAMRAMKARQASLAVTVAANDDAPLAKAA